MKGKPFDWNVVVVGSWNLAILTPAGIAQKVFGLESGTTPVDVQIPLDRQAPIRVVHSNMIVTPSENRLVVAPTECRAETLIDASRLASNAIKSLPETPLAAAGVNFRYQFEDLPDDLLDALKSSLDDNLVDAGLTIKERLLKRTLSWNDGVLNIDIQGSEDSSGTVMFNFHRQSPDSEHLLAWLGQINDMIMETERLVKSTFRINVEGADDE